MAKVLLVDDNPEILKLFADMLSTAGFDVMCAADGREATQQLAPGTVDVMIIDLVMPDFEGLALISVAKLLYPRLRILAISGAFGGEFLHAAELMHGCSCGSRKAGSPGKARQGRIRRARDGLIITQPGDGHHRRSRNSSMDCRLQFRRCCGFQL